MTRGMWEKFASRLNTMDDALELVIKHQRHRMMNGFEKLEEIKYETQWHTNHRW
jgi:hypothetical protein